MAVTVRQAKKVREELQQALEYCGEYLEKSPDHAPLGAQATAAAQRLAHMDPQGREADPADAGIVASLSDAVAVGKAVLDQTDAGRKLPRVRGYIEGAAKVLAA